MGLETSIEYVKEVSSSKREIKFRDVEGMYIVLTHVKFQRGDDVIVNIERQVFSHNRETYKMKRMSKDDEWYQDAFDSEETDCKITRLEDSISSLKRELKRSESRNKELSEENTTLKEAIRHYESFAGLEKEASLLKIMQNL